MLDYSFEFSVSFLTAGRRRTSATNRASSGEELSLVQTNDNGSGISKSIMGKITAPSGHRQRAFPLTQPTPIP